MNRLFQYTRLALVAIVLLSVSVSSLPQEPRPDFSGLWSDTPPTAEDMLCFLVCTDGGVEYLQALLDDPENRDKPSMQLIGATWEHQIKVLTPSYLAPAGLDGYPLDMTKDPGLTHCEPWGFARQIFVPHQMEITQFEDRVEFHYAEWDVVRVIYLDDREPGSSEPTRLGHSVGSYEGDTLVVETSLVSSNYFEGITLGAVKHSDQLHAVERYNRVTDGNRLEVAVTYEDPVTLAKPMHLKRAWAWAPDEEIYEYEDCEPLEPIQ
jgi:hypothetical protein